MPKTAIRQIIEEATLILENSKKVWSKYYKGRIPYDTMLEIVLQDPTSKDRSG